MTLKVSKIWDVRVIQLTCVTHLITDNALFFGLRVDWGKTEVARESKAMQEGWLRYFISEIQRSLAAPVDIIMYGNYSMTDKEIAMCR